LALQGKDNLWRANTC